MRWRNILNWLWALPLMILAACSGTTAEGISVGAQAPDFSLPAATGEQVTLADYAGRPVLLYFHMAVG